VGRSGDRSERSLLVVAGAGGVGSIAIQIAKQVAGLRVIATASRGETEAWCYELGADAVIHHHQPLKGELQRTGTGEVDYVLCAASTEAYFPRLTDVLAPQGKVCFIVGAKGPVNINVLQ